MLNHRESCIQGLPRPRRVLIVDDQHDAATLIAMVLTEEGYDVKVAHDGRAALALALEFEPHIALLDIGLPMMDGYQLAEFLRAQAPLRGCRLIAVSGHCGEQDRTRSRAAGFDLHLAKPLSIDALLLAILPPEGPDAASSALAC
jgi:two-component system, sensor histidine kinase